jgi:hypothetical protein
MELKVKKETELEFNTFIDEWKDTPEGNKGVFLHFMEYLKNKEGVTLDFVARPGVTYSLRAVHIDQKDKDLFVMVDVIEDTTRWLSVCFYNDMIGDPEGKGDFVPGGLLGADALCFDLEQSDEALVRYVESRLDEAGEKAAGK